MEFTLDDCLDMDKRSDIHDFLCSLNQIINYTREVRKDYIAEKNLDECELYQNILNGQFICMYMVKTSGFNTSSNGKSWTTIGSAHNMQKFLNALQYQSNLMNGDTIKNALNENQASKEKKNLL